MPRVTICYSNVRMLVYAVLLCVGAFLMAAASRPGPRDGELMLQIAQGDQRAFSTIYDRHSRPVFASLLRIVRERGAAEDLLQEVFLSLWKHAARYDHEAESVLPWLLVIGRNRALDKVRSAVHRYEGQAQPIDEVFDLRDARANFESGIWHDQSVDRIRACMAQLNEKERRVLELAYFEGLSQSEISSQLGEPMGTVKTWTRNGLNKLRKALL